MKIIKDIKEGINLIHLHERIDSSVAKEFEEEMLSSLETNPQKLIINFTKLDYMSSAGLRVLLMTAKKMKSDNASLVLVGMNQSIEEVFKISGFSKMFIIKHTEVEALETLKGP